MKDGWEQSQGQKIHVTKHVAMGHIRAEGKRVTQKGDKEKNSNVYPAAPVTHSETP